MTRPLPRSSRRSWRRLLVGAAALAVAASGTLAGLTPPAAAAAPKLWDGSTAPLTTPWSTQVGPDNALPDYPRPQLARPSAASPQWTNLNGLWQYAASDGYTPPPVGRTLADRVLVPYPVESALSGVRRHSDFMYYRRQVTVPAAYRADGRHVRLNFGAVNYDATVWVNGQQVARHLGGYDAFSADITPALTARGPQEILVGVHSPVDGATIPVGKQRLDPGGIFYTAASGIWQTVWMEPVAATSIATLTTTPNVPASTLTVTPTIAGDAGRSRVTVKAFDGTRQVATASSAAGVPLALKVPNPHLWSPDDPFLYTIKATLTGPNGTDTVESYAGLRSIEIAQVNGKQRIVLNGKATFLLGTLDQGYWPDGVYTAPTDAALKFDIRKTKDLGFNTIRKHIKVEPARWYYWADKLGMMVWQDMPALPTGRNSSLTTGDKANFRDELSRIETQLQGVTSIIGWVPFNEGWGQWSVEAATEVGRQVKTQDPTRLVDERSGSNCCDTPGDPGTGDVLDWHVYQGPALPAPDATRASMDGEHGGLTLPVEGHTWPGASLNPYGAVPDRAALNAGYVANTKVLRDQGAPYGLSGSVYTQITDVENELNGLFTYDRQVEKVDEARVRAINLQTIAAGAARTPAPPAGRPGLGGVGQWQFDEGSGTTAADSAGSHPLTLQNGASWTTGLSGSALALNGDGQFAATQSRVVATDRRNYSVSAWVRLDAAGDGFQTVVSEDAATNSAFFLQYSGADHRWAFSFVGVRAVATDVGQPVPGRWYHLVGVRDVVASTLTLYVDGSPAAQTSVLGNADVADGPLAVGRGRYNGEPVDYLDGTVDDVRVFNRALSAGEVAQLHDAGAGPTGA
ncbi:LamG-like jellyroll fold domain-containing protein [Jatrophihabitans sp. YIM 134969]